MYLHIPFCRINCNFCSLHRSLLRDDGELESYLSALLRELGEFGDHLGTLRSPRMSALYIGGGTPSVLRVEQLNRLLDRVAAFAPRGVPVEATIECAPDAGRDAAYWASFLGALATRTRLPITRISVGVQAWRDHVLRRMGRGSTKQAVIELLRAADGLLPSYNVDFILGYPREECTVAGQAVEILEAVHDLRELGFSLPSVSVYQLWDVEEIPVLRRRQHEMPSADAVIEALWTIQQGLYGMGYVPGAGTTFVRGEEHRHRWTVHRCREFRHLGFGSGSYSFLPGGFVQRGRDVDGYKRVLSAPHVSWTEIDDRLNTMFRLTAEDVEIRRIIVGLRSGAPVPLAETDAVESLRLGELRDKTRRLCRSGVLEERTGMIALSEDAFMLTNAVSAFLHPADVPRNSAAFAL